VGSRNNQAAVKSSGVTGRRGRGQALNHECTVDAALYEFAKVTQKGMRIAESRAPASSSRSQSSEYSCKRSDLLRTPQPDAFAAVAQSNVPVPADIRFCQDGSLANGGKRRHRRRWCFGCATTSATLLGCDGVSHDSPRPRIAITLGESGASGSLDSHATHARRRAEHR